MKKLLLLLLFAFPVFVFAQNVGIGTTTPVTKLNIVSSGNNPSIPGASSTALFRIGVASNEGIDFGKQSIGPFSAWIQSGFDGTIADPLSLQPLGGNVGIGIISPTEKLDVLGNIRGLNITATQLLTAGTGLSVTGNSNFSGLITADGEINRPSTTTSNLVPIAYGNVSSTGSMNSGTNNCSSTRFNTGIFLITITGESYQFQTYTAVITPVNSGVPVIVTSGSGAGQLQVYLWNTAGAPVDANFHFVIFKE